MSFDFRILPELRRGKLQSLLAAQSTVRCIEAHSGLSALICNGASVLNGNGTPSEFDALWVSSLTGSASRGLPDMEMYVLERRLDLIDEVCQASVKPIIVDGDTGGEPATLEYFCNRLEKMGVSAIVIEDKRNPKRNSLSLESNHVLEDAEVFARKISRARSALQTDCFMIFARLESLIAGETVNEALHRAEVYLASGAHGVMIHSKDREPRLIFEFLKRYRAAGLKRPVICVPTTYNSIRAQELFDQGAQIVIYANHLLRAAHFAMKQVCEEILTTDRSLEVDNICTSISDLFRLVGYDAALERESDRALNR